jgi:hypothetical protein
MLFDPLVAQRRTLNEIIGLRVARIDSNAICCIFQATSHAQPEVVSSHVTFLLPLITKSTAEFDIDRLASENAPAAVQHPEECRTSACLVWPWGVLGCRCPSWEWDAPLSAIPMG